MSQTKLKNFRLGEYSVSQLSACMDDLGLPTQVMAIRIAIAHLYGSRGDLNVTRYLRDLRKNDTKSKVASDVDPKHPDSREEQSGNQLVSSKRNLVSRTSGR